MPTMIRTLPRCITALVVLGILIGAGAALAADRAYEQDLITRAAAQSDPALRPLLPDGTTLEVDGGTTIAEAAQEAGIFLNNLCGGEGVCGECRVRIIKGNAPSKTKTSAFFSKEEVAQKPSHGKSMVCKG